MRSALALAIVACAAMMHTSRAFTCPSASFVAGSRSQNQILLAHPTDDSESIPSLISAKEDAQKRSSSSSSVRRRIRRAGVKAWERMDTLKAAGLCDEGLAPMRSGFKSNVAILVGAFLFKWYRARFITKIPVWDRQPQWNMVVTSPEQEKELHAYQCKQCGSTIFIARHREWFFKGGNTECTNCGAKGTENFMDVRSEVLDSIDDDYFDYESPLDFVSAAERRKLMQQAGGDEEVAKKIAIDNAMKNDKEQVSVEEPPPSSGGKGGSAEPEKKKKSAPKKKSADDDIFDELDMDL
eukprot:CAMPEP_0172549458 /NCGR_PEP_ID=MMETSP1067-20121228/18542_1 /TAXON_ID=265564 ORGANISM="Thalassiosira punctigera, Strain Tpunct2005C2" /NCGR_SAMPLE_ID=MMETSP1067 /ASSEMBLY_ACC=CAM_ASM_000444 /LENGTH=295 /DNA_ID=CAMNT_0013336849 /DNA_START=108 /DNA_END=995 /DNA_ORIENTATION=-